MTASRPTRAWFPKGRRFVPAAASVPLLLILGAVPVAADSGGQTPAALGWIDLKDTRGISVWNYEMSLDRGGVTSPGKIIWSFLIDFFWQLYKSVVVVAIWFIDWVLSFGWLTTIAAPVVLLADSVQSMIDRFGLTPVLLTVAATVAVLWMAKGKWALGIFELFTSLVIASLAVGVFSNPVQQVTGADGLIMQSRDVGLEVANNLATNGEGGGDADQMRATVTGSLTDTFIRIPAQMINFGTVLDGGDCEQEYNDVISAGPYGTESDIRDAIGECDEALGDVAANPGSGQAISAVVISPAAALILAFAIILSGAIMLAGIYALYQGLKAIVTLVTGLLPGSARGALWQTAADLTMALVTVVFSIVFLTSFLLLIKAVFAAGDPGGGVMATFFFVDILLVFGIILFWRARKSLRQLGDRLAAALATRPGGGPTALPTRKQFNPSSVYYNAKMAGNVASGAGHATSAAVHGVARGRDGAYSVAGKAATMAARPVGTARQRLRFPSAVFGSAAAAGAAGDGQPPLTTGGAQGRAEPTSASPAAADSGPAGAGTTAAGESAAARVTGRVARGRGRAAVGGKLLRVASRAAVGVATGGASTVATAAAAAGATAKVASAARTARRVAVTSRLAAGARKSTAAPSGTPPPRLASTAPAKKTPAPTPAPASRRPPAASAPRPKAEDQPSPRRSNANTRPAPREPARRRPPPVAPAAPPRRATTQVPAPATTVPPPARPSRTGGEERLRAALAAVPRPPRDTADRPPKG